MHFKRQNFIFANQKPCRKYPTGHISYVRYHLVHTYSIGYNGATAFFYVFIDVQRKKLPDELIYLSSAILTIHGLS